MTAMDRAAGLGASEAAAALGLDPYTSPTELWMAKTGQGGDEKEASLAMTLGTLLEEPVARLYARQTGWLVKRHRLPCAACKRAGTEYACDRSAVFDKQHPWLFAHLDRITRAEVGMPWQALEIKTTGWPGEEWGESGSDQVPLRVLVQVIIQMRLTGYRSAVVAALLWGRDLRHYPISHSPELERQVLDELRYFWHLVQSGQPPVHADHRQTGAALRRLYSRDNGLQVVAGADDWALVEEVLAAYATWKGAEATYDVAKNRAMARLGSLAGLQWDGGSITWKSQERRSTRWQAVAEWAGSLAVEKGVLTKQQYAELVANSTEVASMRPFRVHVKKGAAGGD